MPTASFSAGRAAMLPPEDPVFIHGMHRSGTTLLHQMLAEMDHWNTVWAWHVACYDEIRAGKIDFQTSLARYTQRLAEAGEENRGVDNVRAGPETKEEFSFILINKGSGRRLRDKSFAQFLEICETVQSTYPQRRPLLLKNPWDFGHADEILKLIPTARFIYIHRNPIEVISSQLRLLVTAFRRPNAYIGTLNNFYAGIVGTPWKLKLLRLAVEATSQIAEGLIMLCGRQCDRYLRSIESVPPSARIEITYDELCARPNATMARIRSQFCIPDNGTDFSWMIDRRSPKLHRQVAARSAKIERRMRDYLHRLDELNRQAGLADESAALEAVTR